MQRTTRNMELVLAAVLVLAAILLVLFYSGCGLLQSPPGEPGGPPATVTFSGQVVTAGEQTKPLPGAVVKIGSQTVALSATAVFRVDMSVADKRVLSVTAEGYKSVRRIFDARQSFNFTQIRMKQAAPKWDFETTRLLGWSDPVSGAYYYPEKAKAIDEDIAKYGSNCGVVNVNRSNGTQYHSGKCANNKGWYRHIRDDGYLYQFCKKNAAGDWDTSHIHFPYENVHESSELSIKWIDQMEGRVKSLHDTGQWAIVNLWCPYDNKWFGINWYYWTQDCSESPFTVGPNSRWYHPKQKVATQALLNRIKIYPNVVITENWEEMGFDDSVDLAWKKMCFSWVQEVMPGVPYFVYIGDDTKDIPAVVAWVNSEPRIAGVNTHYKLHENVRADLGLNANKRVLHTEEMDLNAPATFRAIEWCMSNNDETCMYYGNYRDFMRGDGGPDTDKAVRDEWNPKIADLLK